ncbi:MAG: methyltransferase domain-containing protein [Candidatus Brocadiae bacterium]|nr:methyltransferase domain-containing protein [Candidatus Brocadiia bacterium]
MNSIINFFRKARIHFLRKVLEKGGKFDMAMVKPAPSFLGKLMSPLRNWLIPSERFEYIYTGPMGFAVLRAACNIGVFELLDKKPGLKIAEIAEALKLEEYPAKLLLMALVSIKMIYKIGDEYYGDPFLVKPLLKDSCDGFMLKQLEYTHHLIAPAMHCLQESIIKNKPVGLTHLFGENAGNYYYEVAQDSERNRCFEQFMNSFSQINQPRIASMSVFSRFKKILDVGGNTGALAMSIARNHPDVKITVFDFPSVVESAKKNFKENQLDNRLDAIGGNILESPLPQGYDCVIFSHFIDLLSEKMNKELIQKAMQSLVPGGTLFIFSPIVNDEETEPFLNCMMGLYFLCLANGVGQFYSGKTIMDWMKEAGFHKLEKRLLPFDEAVFTGQKP